MAEIHSSTSETKASFSGASTLKMGLPTMMAVCIGVVIVQGAMISGMQGIGIGGLGFIAAMFVALVLAQFNAMSFSELSLMFPQEGTLATYTQKAIGHFPAIVAVFSGYGVVAILAIPVEMVLVDAMLDKLMPGVIPEKVVPLLILIALSITNLIGTDVFAKVQNFLAFILVCALIIVGLVAITGLGAPYPALSGTTVDWSFTNITNFSFIGLVALSMWLFVGVEFICPMINEVKNPNKSIPLAMQLSLVMMFLIFVAFVVGAGFYVNVETLLGSAIPYLDYISAVFGNSGLAIATVMALAATCSTINTILASVPRMLHGMAYQKQAFPQLKASNKYGAPWIGIVMISGCIGIAYLIANVDSLVTLVISASTCWLLAYVVAHIDVMVLRRRLPNHERPYRTPFYPLPQVLGIVTMIYIALNNSPSPEMTNTVFVISGTMILMLSIVGGLWVKFYMKRGLFEPDME
jgi:amino acid transporter